MGRLDELDLSRSLTRKEESRRLERAWERLAQLRLTLGGQIGDRRLGPPVLVVFEGWDASGKGGAIKRLVAQIDPRHVRVVQFAAPTPDEKRHHFLWRFWPALPGWGGMAILDRSWYGRVLVERVEGFATREQWLRAYDEINSFERTLADEGMILIKLWLHISEGEQLKRFERRREDPLKAWKLTEEDWRNRGKRAEYQQAVEDMLARTDQAYAPWHLIEADSKRYARVKVVETVIDRIERGLAQWGMTPPEPLAGARNSVRLARTVTEQDLELMRTGYALWNQGDIDGLVERCLAEDVEFHPAPNWPGWRVYRGSEEVATFLVDEVAAVISLSEIEIVGERVIGDEVVFSLRTKVHGEQSGVDIDMVSVFHVARIEDGRVTRIRAFLDEDAAMQAVGAA